MKKLTDKLLFCIIIISAITTVSVVSYLSLLPVNWLIIVICAAMMISSLYLIFYIINKLESEDDEDV